MWVDGVIGVDLQDYALSIGGTSPLNPNFRAVPVNIADGSHQVHVIGAIDRTGNTSLSFAGITYAFFVL